MRFTVARFGVTFSRATDLGVCTSMRTGMPACCSAVLNFSRTPVISTNTRISLVSIASRDSFCPLTTSSTSAGFTS